MFVTLCVFSFWLHPPPPPNYIKILICLLRLKCDCTLTPLTPLVKNHQSIPGHSALQVQLLGASQVGPACASQTGGERGDFLSRDWVDWKEAPGWVPGENANITVQNRTKKNHTKHSFFDRLPAHSFCFGCPPESICAAKHGRHPLSPDALRGGQSSRVAASVLSVPTLPEFLHRVHREDPTRGLWPRLWLVPRRWSLQNPLRRSWPVEREGGEHHVTLCLWTELLSTTWSLDLKAGCVYRCDTLVPSIF